MSPDQRFVLEVQTKAWLAGMRVAWVRRYGVERGECPVPAWDAIAQQDKVILMAAISEAVKAGRPENVERARQKAAEAQELAAIP